MSLYYVNKNEQDNGYHDVHTESCGWLPKPENRIYLGTLDTCQPAVKEAKKQYSQSNGCAYCCAACHTQ